jgi:hypothetical protein
MVYNTFENYDLGLLKAKLFARQEYSIDHVSYRYYKLKSQFREGVNDVTFFEKVSKCKVEYSCRIVS